VSLSTCPARGSRLEFGLVDARLNRLKQYSTMVSINLLSLSVSAERMLFCITDNLELLAELIEIEWDALEGPRILLPVMVYYKI